MRILFVALISLVISACGPDGKTTVNNDNDPGDPNNPARKLRDAQKDSLLMTSMVISRFGEIDQIAEILMNDPRSSRSSCPAVDSITETDRRNQINVAMTWENCPGEFQVRGTLEGLVKFKSNNKGYTLQQATLKMSDSDTAKYREKGRGSYDVNLQTFEFVKGKQNNYTFRSRLQLERRASSGKEQWTVLSSQQTTGKIRNVTETRNPDQPRGGRYFYEVTMTSAIEQQTQGESKSIFVSNSMAQLDDLVAVNRCGFLEGNYYLEMRSDRLDKAVHPDKPVIVGTQSLTDGFGSSYRYGDCSDPNDGLQFVKTNLKSLMAYRIRD